jgi:hypothetical protein
MTMVNQSFRIPLTEMKDDKFINKTVDNLKEENNEYRKG